MNEQASDLCVVALFSPFAFIIAGLAYGQVTPGNEGTLGLGGPTSLVGGAGGASGAGVSGGAVPGEDCDSKGDDTRLFEAACAAHCSASRTMCINVYSAEPCRAEPIALDAGETLTVKVLGPVTCREKDIDLSTRSVPRKETLLREPVDAKDKQIAPVDWGDLAKMQVTAETDPSFEAVEVRFSAWTGASDVYTVPIRHGTYLLDFGLLVAFVPNGEDRIRSVRLAGTNELVLQADEVTSVRPAFAVNVFFGRRHGVICGICTGPHGSAGEASNFLGLQVGMGLDLDRLDDEFFGGLIVEPVQGLSVNFGIALLRMGQLPPGYAAGMLLDAPIVIEESLLPRFYLGITISPEIVDSAMTVGRGLHGKLQ